MISSDKQIIALGLGVACAASPFSRVDAVALSHVAAETGDEKSPLDDTIARKLADKAGKADPSNGAGHSDTSKGGKNPPSSSKAHKDPTTTPFFVASASCAGDCISSNYSPDSHFLMNAIEPCDANSLRQQWDFLQHGTFTMMKSVGASADSTHDWCVGVVQQGDDGLGGWGNLGTGMIDFAGSGIDVAFMRDVPGIELKYGRAAMFGILGRMVDEGGHILQGDGWNDHDMCSNGAKLGLVPCGDPASLWYPTDGQIVSALCWSLGLTSLLTAEGCNELSLSTTTATDGASAPITRAETFMAVDKEFIESIPPPAPTDAPTDAPTTPIPTSPAPTPTETYTDAPTTPQPTDESDQPSSAPSTTTVVQECGSYITNKKVVLSSDLTCPDPPPGSRVPFGIVLDGPKAEIDCNGFELSVSEDAIDSYQAGIYLMNGATATNCNVQRFANGIFLRGDGEVVNSDISFNNNTGIWAYFTENSTLTIENTNVTNNGDYGLLIESRDGADAMVYVNGEVIIDNNSSAPIIPQDNGVRVDVASGSNLNVVVNEGATLASCRNTLYDITGFIESDTNVAFSGDGTYVCDQSKVLFTGDGNETVVEPTCQECPLRTYVDWFIE